MSKADLTALPFPIQRALAYQELFELLGYDMHHVTIAFVDLDAVAVPTNEKALVAWLEDKTNFVCFCGSVPIDWVSASRWEAEVADVWEELSAKERDDHRRRFLPSEEVYELVRALMARELPPPRLFAELEACTEDGFDDDRFADAAELN